LEGRALAVAEDQVHPRRPTALDALDLPVVEEQLKDVCRLRRAPELGVMDLVRPPAQLGRLGHSRQEIRISDPPVVQEAGLVDHLATRAHGPLGRGGSIGRAAVAVEREDVSARVAQRLEEGLLVAASALEQQLGVRLRIVLAGNLTALGAEVEVGAVLAAEEVVEPARREQPVRCGRSHARGLCWVRRRAVLALLG
jgi:hypothetical protein